MLLHLEPCLRGRLCSLVLDGAAADRQTAALSPVPPGSRQTHPASHRCLLPLRGHSCSLPECQKGHPVSSLPQTTLQKALYPEFTQWHGAVWRGSHRLPQGSNATPQFASWRKPTAVITSSAGNLRQGTTSQASVT